MTRLLLIAAIPLALAGCRSSCGRTSMTTNPCQPHATPVSYGTPVQSFPASYSVPQPVMPTSYPIVPTANPNAAELPFPQETIPPPGLPTSGLPNGSRAVGLPK